MCTISGNKTVTTDKAIETTLRSLGLNNSYKGFHYLILAIHLVLEDADILTYICKGLYVEIAIRYGTTVAGVERNIRTAKEIVWANGDTNLLKRIFGDRYALKIPDNAHFIDALTYYIRTLRDEER